MCRIVEGQLEVLLAHPGGPFFSKKDAGVWTIPKGLVEPGEDPRDAAVREFVEETGFVVDRSTLVELGEIRQKGGKRVLAWAFLGDAEPAALESNLFEMEWPPRSGKRRSFPEIDRVDFFTLDTAKTKILAAQIPLLERANEALRSDGRRLA